MYLLKFPQKWDLLKKKEVNRDGHLRRDIVSTTMLDIAAGAVVHRVRKGNQYEGMEANVKTKMYVLTLFMVYHEKV